MRLAARLRPDPLGELQRSSGPTSPYKGEVREGRVGNREGKGEIEGREGVGRDGKGKGG